MYVCVMTPLVPYILPFACVTLRMLLLSRYGSGTSLLNVVFDVSTHPYCYTNPLDMCTRISLSIPFHS